MLPPPALPDFAIDYGRMLDLEDDDGTGIAGSHNQFGTYGTTVRMIEQWNGWRWSAPDVSGALTNSDVPNFEAITALVKLDRTTLAVGVQTVPFYNNAIGLQLISQWDGNSWSDESWTPTGQGVDHGWLNAASLGTAGTVWTAGVFDGGPIVEDNAGGSWSIDQLPRIDAYGVLN